MNESYRKMNQTQKASRNSNEWIGANTGKFGNKPLTTNIYDDNKGWMGQVQQKTKIVQSKLQTPRHIQQPSSRAIITNPPNQNKPSLLSQAQKYNNNKQTPINKLLSNPGQSRTSSLYSPQKSPMQLMNDIFRSIGMHHLSNSKTYYSKQTEEHLCQLLTNRNKLNNYLKKLSNQMGDAPPEVEKNYQILMVLLQQLSEADLQIHQDQNGLHFYFNRTQLSQKEKQIQKLQKQLEQKNKQTQKIIEQYQAVIRNFNDVIEKLIIQKKH